MPAFDPYEQAHLDFRDVSTERNDLGAMDMCQSCGVHNSSSEAHAAMLSDSCALDMPSKVVTDFDAILKDDSINCVVELMGGTTAAKDVSLRNRSAAF